MAFALPDGHAAAVKIEDGAARALPAVTVALLRSLGVDASGRGRRHGPGPDSQRPRPGGGRAVGHIRPVLPM